MNFLFSYIAQPHQTLHSLPITIAIAQKYPDIQIHIACTTQQHLSYIQSLTILYPDITIQYHLLSLPKYIHNRIEARGSNAFF